MLSITTKNRLRDGAARAIWTLPHDRRRSMYRRLNPSMAAMHDNMRRYDLDEREGLSVSLVGADRLSCIFLHIPKNGGTSVGRTLFGEYGGNHMPIGTYQLIYDRETYSSMFKFGFSRNPFDRLLSGYRFARQGAERVAGARAHNRDGRPTNKPLPKVAAGAYDTFEEFVLEWVAGEGKIRDYEHFRPQYRFACDPAGRLGLDFVGRFENFAEDFATVQERLGVTDDLMHDRRSSSEGDAPYRDHYTPAMRAVVEKVFERDLRLFDYTFDG